MRLSSILFILLMLLKQADAEITKAEFAGAARTPPMGWMSWERFRCDINCKELPNGCINADLYSTMATRLKEDGYLDAGYNTVHIDDCWMTYSRDETTQQMIADSQRFPNGIRGLAVDVHKKGIRLGLYTDIGTNTCAGYAGSAGYETVDANSYAEWGVDYLKVDGCFANVSVYESGYPKLGEALQQSGREITYSCSWPAYLGDDESVKPYDQIIDAGCNLWRNWHDIENNWKSISTIIDYFGNYSDVLSTVAGPGHWNDMDMVMAGNDHTSADGRPVLTLNQAKIQLSIWSIMASPLIMSNDLRTVPAEYRKIILNKDMIAVNQDPLGQAGKRILKRQGDGLEIWARSLSGNRMAIVLYNPNFHNDQRVEVELTTKDWAYLSETILNGTMWDSEIDMKDVWSGREDTYDLNGKTFHDVLAPMSCMFLIVSSPGISSPIPLRFAEVKTDK